MGWLKRIFLDGAGEPSFVRIAGGLVVLVASATLTFSVLNKYDVGVNASTLLITAALTAKVVQKSAEIKVEGKENE